MTVTDFNIEKFLSNIQVLNDLSLECTTFTASKFYLKILYEINIHEIIARITLPNEHLSLIDANFPMH